ncbi:hypothetical protein ACJIZ3_004916 [Penstemon smallii]|uniref:Uncharacterized protein n=1 Tax=Penstemon smallii TaxID=265156 RepID=A0ABD3S3L1_9LAMI
MKIIPILLLFSCVKAQETSNQPDMNPLHPSLAVVLVVLSIMFCLTFLIVAYAKFCHSPNPYDPNEAQLPGGIIRSRSRSRFSDLKSLTYTNSFRTLHNYTEEPNLEFFIQREKNLESSSRFSLSNAIEKFSRGKREEFLIQNERKVVHNVKHKIIVSDVMHRSRWSDVNSSDMISLNSEMLNVVSSKRFSSMESSGKEHILKIKDDMERKRLYESKFDKIKSSTSLSNPNIELEQSTMLNSLDSSQKRSMSEITNVSRFRELNVMSIQTNMEKGDEIRKVWLPIAKRTIQLFAGRDQRSSDSIKHNDIVNV